jgi:phosphoenolpyruvate carboxylase
MIEPQLGALEKFNDCVGIKFQLYNSLFLSLPFYGVDKTGILLSLFSRECEDGYSSGKDPVSIVEKFLEDKTPDESVDLLFRFVQYAERQVVLFDALEDAAFPELNDMQGAGTLKNLETAVQQVGNEDKFLSRLGDFSVRLVLTAHPTQFYPGSVLGIINDLVRAILENDIAKINTILQQLGRTPFLNKQKPTPSDEASSLIWYLENVFYDSAGNILSNLTKAFPNADINSNEIIRMGFWPGGDRDGNPFVTASTTREVAAALNRAILRCYYGDVRKLKRRLTFAGVETLLANLEKQIYDEAFQPGPANLSKQAILEGLADIREMLLSRHNGLFVHLVEDLILKVNVFGLFFASLDIRQDGSIHGKVIEHLAQNSALLPDNYGDLSEAEKADVLLNISQAADVASINDEMAKETLLSVQAMRDIQSVNGSEGCERYIISQCKSSLNVAEVYGLLLLGGFAAEGLEVDIVPLFETIADLENAAEIMRYLYEVPVYRKHISKRRNRQTVMLGFSDGTKDGGYLMANWSIYQAKNALTKLSREFGIDVIFFDGRGGPPARGGGKTQKFYSSMGQNIQGDAIQLTIQGQTVSSNFGTVDSAQYNIEQLLHAGLFNQVTSVKKETFTLDEEYLIADLATRSLRAYQELKDDPHFLNYLSDISPLRFYAETNIASRPSKRSGGKLTLEDLRAIPFVGAWSQIKQNVPGFYGLGAALEEMKERFEEISKMYKNNAFFKTLIDNCEMAMQKSFFPLTAFLADDPVYGCIWKKIHAEYKLCRMHIAAISGKSDLMSDFPVEQQSVRLREKIVVPLITIQQYALTRLRGLNGKKNLDPDLKRTLERLVIRCSFGIINAGRNSA